MAELLLELQGEEIPARMQQRAVDDLQRLVLEALAEAGLGGRLQQCYSTPRRLAVVLDAVADIQPDSSEERRGPREDAPPAAIEGFLKSAGISRDEAELRDTPKGRFLFAVINKKGKPSTTILPELVNHVLSRFPWPKSQRWGRSAFTWVRPLHRITLLLDGKALTGRFDLGGGMAIEYGCETIGHGIIAPQVIRLEDAASYAKRLEQGFVIADRAARRQRIIDQLGGLADEAGLLLRMDEALLDEVCGLVEWPHAILGDIDADFMTLPEEVLVTSMRSHQKYFALSDQHGNLAPHFITIANMPAAAARDATIRQGNARVLRARLADAQFFWQQDRAVSSEERLQQLGSMAFFEGLGTLKEKAGRLEQLSTAIAEAMGCDGPAVAAAGRGGLLAKTDLTSQMVGEFPELQGVMGGHYARAEGEADLVVGAISQHYRPAGQDEACPETAVARAVSLADKLDTLAGFFRIGAVPTGSKDPYALRRAALGIIRIILEAELQLNLASLLKLAAQGHGDEAESPALLPFFHDRLKVLLRGEGIGHDRVSAVINEQTADVGDLLHLASLARGLQAFLATDDGSGLIAGWRRAASILAAEEKRDGKRYDGPVIENLLIDDTEIELNHALDALTAAAVRTIDTAMPTHTEAQIMKMEALSQLRAPIDAFFEAVVVNDDVADRRRNRLNLLGRVRLAMRQIADFSAIEG